MILRFLAALSEATALEAALSGVAEGELQELGVEGGFGLGRIRNLAT